MAQSDNNEISRMGFLFGDDFNQEESVQFLKGQIQINKDAANTQLHELESQTDSKITVPWSFVLKFALKDINKEKIIEYFEVLKNSDGSNTHQYDGFQLFIILGQAISEKTLEISYVENNGYFYVSLSPSGSLNEEVQNNYQTFFDMGLKDIAEQQNNIIDASISSKRSAEQITQDVKGGERLLSAILQNIKFESQLSLNKQLGIKLKEIAAQVDPEFANSPPFIFLRYFKSLDIDLRFASTADLPQSIRNNVLFGEFLQNSDQSVQDLEKNSESAHLFKVMESEFETFFTIPDFLAFSTKGTNIGFTQYFGAWGKKLFGEKQTKVNEQQDEYKQEDQQQQEEQAQNPQPQE